MYTSVHVHVYVDVHQCVCRYDMSTSMPLTKWPPNFRMILLCYFFSVDDVSRSTIIPELFLHASTLQFGFRISILYFIIGEIAAPINHMKWASVPIPVGLMKAIGILFSIKRQKDNI